MFISNDGYGLTKETARDLSKWYRANGMKQLNSCNAAVRWISSERAELLSYTTRVMVADRVYINGVDGFVVYHDGINTYSRTTTGHIGKFLGLLDNGTPHYISPLVLCSVGKCECVRVGYTTVVYGGSLNDSIKADVTKAVRGV